ncbi:MAG: trigger factor [Candidatus Omnitrophota bacterium]|nr:MAG: trigger factor [Candidatus Omnitrophota bacterium]
MEVKIKKLSAVEKELEVKLTSREISSIREKVYKTWQENSQIPGYRKGKAPLEIVLKRYKEEIEKDLKENLATFFYKQAIKEANVEPVSYPVILSSSLTVDGGFVFKMKIEERPEVKLPKYKGLKVEKKAPEVKDEEVDKVLEDLKQERARWEDVIRPSKEGDYIILDMEIYVDDKSVEKKEKVGVLLDTKVVLPQLVENLKGLVPGSGKEFEIDIPSGYPDKKLAGKRCRYKVKIHNIREKREPDINDAFAQQLGEYKNLEELRQAIRQELQNYKHRRSEMEVEEKLVQELVTRSRLEVPSQLLEIQARRIAEDIVLRLLYRGIPREDVERQMETIWEEARKEADKQLRLSFILDEVIRKENIDVSQQELDDYLKQLAEQRKTPFEELKTQLEKSREIGNIKEQIKKRKALELIKENAHIVRKEEV